MTNDTANENVRVDLGARSYDIRIGPGLLENAGELLSPLLNRPQVVIVTDDNVATSQLPRLAAGLEAQGIAFKTIVMAAGESTKSFAQLEFLTRRLLELEVERDDLVIALGGGVIGDLVGFAAAILRRGCRFAQIPTTLLAQVDSSVGGKTAINAPEGKNLIGAFHQPAIVIADITALQTLPPRELRAGYAEVVKYGAINDEPFFAWLEENGPALLNGDVAARAYAINKSCAAKAAIVAADEREAGERALLNLGHTFGHAFEAVYGYSSALLHGEGVALGMALAFEYSARSGLAAPEAAARIKAHLKAVSLPAEIGDLPAGPTLDADTLCALMMQDKKVTGGKLTLILADAIGAARIVKDADRADINAFLKEKIA